MSSVWSDPDNVDFSTAQADFPFIMDGQDWPDTSNAVIPAPFEPDVGPTTPGNKFPELEEVHEL